MKTSELAGHLLQLGEYFLNFGTLALLFIVCAAALLGLVAMTRGH